MMIQGYDLQSIYKETVYCTSHLALQRFAVLFLMHGSSARLYKTSTGT